MELFNPENQDNKYQDVHKPDNEYEIVSKSWQLVENLLLPFYDYKNKCMVPLSHEKERIFNERKNSATSPAGYKEEINATVGSFLKDENLWVFDNLNPTIRQYFEDDYLITNNKSIKELLPELLFNIIHFGSVSGIFHPTENNIKLHLFHPLSLIGVVDENNIILQIRELGTKSNFDLVRSKTTTKNVVTRYTLFNNIFTFEQFESNNKNESKWELIESIIPKFKGQVLNFLPIVHSYANSQTKVSTLRSYPVLLKLAELNAHYIDMLSHHNYATKIVTSPVLKMTCSQIDENDYLVPRITEQDPVMPGLAVALYAGDENQAKEDLAYLDTNPLTAGIKCNENVLETIKKQMQLVGHQLLTDEKQNVTATLTTLENKHVKNQKIAVALAVTDFLQQCANTLGVLLNVKDVGIVEPNLKLLDDSETFEKQKAELLLKTYVAGTITKETFLKELISNGVLTQLDIDSIGDEIDITNENI